MAQRAPFHSAQKTHKQTGLLGRLAKNNHQLTEDDVVAFREDLRNGKTVASMKGISDEETDELYRAGYVFYEQKRYEDALKIFSLLVGLDHLSARNACALASACYMLGRYEEALSGYGAAAMLSVSDPVPIYHAAECLLALKRPGEALRTVELACDVAAGKDEYKELMGRLNSMKTRIKNLHPMQ